MMLSDQLAEVFVMFKAKGQRELNQTFDETEKKTKAAEKNSKNFEKALEGLGNTFKGLRTVAIASLGAATAAVYGLARAGLSLTAEGAYIATQFQFLSREIANLFIPVIRATIDILQQAIDWFRSLDLGQQRALGTVLALGIAFVGATGAIAAVAAAIGTVVGVLGPFATAILPVIAGVAALGAASSSGQNALGTLWETLQGVYQAMRPLISAVVFLFNEISVAIGNVFQSLAQDTAGALPAIRDAAAEIGQFLREAAPFVASVFGAMFDWASRTFRVVLQVFQEMSIYFPKIRELFTRLANVAARIWIALKPLFDRLMDSQAEQFGRVLEFAVNALIAGLEAAVVIMETLVNKARTIANVLAGIIDPFGLFGLADIGNNIGNALGPAGSSPLSSFPQLGTGNFGNGQQAQSLRPQGGGFEDVRAAFRRFQERALRESAPAGPEQQTAQNTQQMNQAVQWLVQWLQQNTPAILQPQPAPVGGQGVS